MSDADTIARLTNISHYFLRGLLNTSLFAIDVNDFNTAATGVPDLVTADLTSAAYSATSPFNNVLDLTPHVAHLLANGSVPPTSGSYVALQSYAQVLNVCLRGGNVTAPPNPTFVSFGGASNVACPLINVASTPYVDASSTGAAADWLDRAGTYHDADPLDVSGGLMPAAHRRLAAVANTYTLKRVALYYVLLANATVLAYDKIMVAAAGATLPAGVLLDGLFQLTMQQFVEFNNLYDNSAEANQEPLAAVTPAQWSPAASATTAGVIALGGAATGLGGSGWATSAGAAASPAFAFALPPPGVAGNPQAVVITPWATGNVAGSTNLAAPLVFAFPTALTASATIGVGSSNVFDVTPAPTNPALQNPAQVAVPWNGAPVAFPLAPATVGAATLVITDGQPTAVANVGFQGASFPNPSFPGPAFYASVPGGGYAAVWAGVDDLAYLAVNAVGTAATGWATPAAALDPTDPTHATVMAVPQASAYWACAFPKATPVTSYTVAPFPDGRLAASGWTVYVTNAPGPFAATTVGTIPWTQVGGPVVAAGTTTTYALENPLKEGCTAFMIAPYGTDPSTGSPAYGGVGFYTIALNQDAAGRTDLPTLDVMGTMAASEGAYQAGIATLNADSDRLARTVRVTERQARKAVTANAEAARARTLLWAIVVVALASVAATAAVLLGLGQGHGRAILAAALIAGLVAAAAVAALAR